MLITFRQFNALKIALVRLGSDEGLNNRGFDDSGFFLLRFIRFSLILVFILEFGPGFLLEFVLEFRLNFA